jgi:hypothetical protein
MIDSSSIPTCILCVFAHLPCFALEKEPTCANCSVVWWGVPLSRFVGITQGNIMFIVGVSLLIGLQNAFYFFFQTSRLKVLPPPRIHTHMRAHTHADTHTHTHTHTRTHIHTHTHHTHTNTHTPLYYRHHHCPPVVIFILLIVVFILQPCCNLLLQR